MFTTGFGNLEFNELCIHINVNLSFWYFIEKGVFFFGNLSSFVLTLFQSYYLISLACPTEEKNRPHKFVLNE